ncbi:MAG: gfo/Idh/MocA family oxidoreductase [Halomonadaceae bacterium]|nr:MAG: gfo/Idh/MocA family oxidoreductase [Halomonadaceae bacterium]
MTALRAAVVGAGHLGRFHARKYAALPGVELVAVVDINLDRARQLAGETGAEALDDHQLLPGRVDLVSVAVPASRHFIVCRDLLWAGIHVLVEKPMTTSLVQARQLITLADQQRCVLQPGYVERFSPVWQSLQSHCHKPLFIRASRLSSFSTRGNDVDVVLDLMIHDIDHILQLVPSPVARIDASGRPVMTRHSDIADARLHFCNGCVARLTASRISSQPQRRLRIFQQDQFYCADLHKNTLERFSRPSGWQSHPLKRQDPSPLKFPLSDPLQAEIQAFIACIRHRRQPQVSPRDGMRALKIAHLIMQHMSASPMLTTDQRAPTNSGGQPK